MPGFLRRGQALLFCLLLAAGLVVSACFLARESRHTCTGPDCPVCASLRVAAAGLRAAAGRSRRPALTAPVFAPVARLGTLPRQRPAATPVNHKVRLDR